MRIHTGKPFVCSFNGCNATFAESGGLATHKRIHTGEKPFACNFNGCNAKFSQSSARNTHMRIHTGEKPFACTFKDCNANFSESGGLDRHMRTHTGAKPFVCDFKDCSSTFAQSGGLDRHMRTHTDARPFVCDFKDCNSTFAQKAHLNAHYRTHTGEKPFKCTFDECGSAFARSHHLKGHVQSMHSVEGVKRQKKQENRVRTLLQEWDFVVDEEIQINVARKDCVPDTDRQFARVDFMVVSCTSCILFVECDEEQHFWYEVSCECSRMADIVTALRIAGCEKAIHFLRYSPNGAFEIDGVRHSRVARTVREEHLKSRIQEISDGPEPEQLLTIEYLFYDADEDDMPLVLMDDDYPAVLAASVVPSPAPETL